MTSTYRRLHEALSIPPDYHLADTPAPGITRHIRKSAAAALVASGELKPEDGLMTQIMARLALLPWDTSQRIKRMPMQEYSAAVQSRIDRTREAIRNFPKANNVTLAARLGCSVQTVRNHRRRMRAAGEAV